MAFCCLAAPPPSSVHNLGWTQPQQAPQTPPTRKDYIVTQALLWTSGGAGFTAFMTALGAAMVFLFQKHASKLLQQMMLGFAAGVMIAASIWSLLIPAIEKAEALGMTGWLPAAGGIILGIAFLLVMDHLLPQLTPDSFRLDQSMSSRRTALLVLAVTLHNIPEGMAIGISFALAAQSGDPALLTSAIALSIGIGIQNFPEGAAIALPLHQDGISAPKSFLLGAVSGIVEPFFAILTVLLVGAIHPLMPWLLSFAAGAMLYVVVEELIPEANLSDRFHAGTLGVMCGFLIMMVLDVALG